jgi:hemolysin D
MSFEGFSHALSGAFGRLLEPFDRLPEREFLPAALEVLETPPSPAGRAVAITIMAFVVLAAAWAFMARVDVTATAAGQLAPVGKVRLVQPLDAGVVRAIRAQDGDHVKAGDVLIELDPTDTGADRDRLSHDLMQAELDVARLTALKHGGEDGAAPGKLAPPAGAAQSDLEQANAAARAQADEQAAKIAGLDQQISQKKAESEEVAAEIAKLNASLPLLEEKERLRKKLYDQGLGASFTYLDAQQQLSEARHDLQVQAARGAQAEDARAALLRQRDQARSQFSAAVLDDLAKAEQRRSELSEELVKAQRKASQTVLRAPASGVVEQLAVHTIGGVVTPAQRLLVVVPDGERLTVEAALANRDVGFVHPGQDVQVKVETFSFTRYGLIHGRVLDVSRDAVTPAASADDVASGAPGPRKAGGSPAYIARIGLDRSDMMIDGRLEPLVPGMAVTADIRTGRRTVIDYLLSPLARRAEESLHER